MFFCYMFLCCFSQCPFFTSLCTLSLLLSVPPERSKQERTRCTLRVRTDYDSERLCCGTRYAQTGPRNAFGTMFAHRILLTDSLAIAATMHFQFSIIHFPFTICCYATSDFLENWREKGTKSPAKGALLP